MSFFLVTISELNKRDFEWKNTSFHFEYLNNFLFVIEVMHE